MSEEKCVDDLFDEWIGDVGDGDESEIEDLREAFSEGFYRAQQSRTPGPATAAFLEHINVTLRGVYKHRGCIAVEIPAELLRGLDAEFSAHENGPGVTGAGEDT